MKQEEGMSKTAWIQESVSRFVGSKIIKETNEVLLRAYRQWHMGNCCQCLLGKTMYMDEIQ